MMCFTPRLRLAVMLSLLAMNQFEVSPSYQQQASIDCQREWSCQTCDMCDGLGENIEHHRHVVSDQLTVERITALIAELVAQKALLHPEQEWRPFAFIGFVESVKKVGRGPSQNNASLSVPMREPIGP